MSVKVSMPPSAISMPGFALVNETVGSGGSAGMVNVNVDGLPRSTEFMLFESA